jgi:DNA-binding NarL/FixJ family response regulator
VKGYADTRARPLTPRMVDVARCGAAGLSAQQTALELSVSVQTVWTIRAALVARLDAPNFTAAVVLVERDRAA